MKARAVGEKIQLYNNSQYEIVFDLYSVSKLLILCKFWVSIYIFKVYFNQNVAKNCALSTLTRVL